jgi:multidrug efflux pump subunit AcrB
MWIVRLALRRPFTIAVLAIFIMIMGVLSLKYMMVDIFPTIDIPVVGVVWSYPGLSAEDMERRVVLLDERAISSTVNGVSRIESQSVAGIGLMKIYFEQGADIGAAIAQISAVGNTVTHSMPAGIAAPIVIQFNASNLPVAQITASSETIPEEKLFDYSLNFIRIRLFTIPGLAIPAPYGGKGRQISVDIDPRLLASRGLSATDVVTALQNANVILPTGTARLGTREYSVTSNASPSAVEQFRQIPVRVVGGQTVMLGDIATVSDGFSVQTNIVRVNSHRAIYLAIIKKANASTLAVVDAAKEALPEIKQTAPEGMDLRLDFDQSTFVRSAINSVLREAVVASILVSLLILLFLGSWRSVIIVCTSIPLAIMTSIVGLMLTGNSINIMTLGGLSLAIGMLVDDATVEVENIHRNRLLGKPLTVAILDGARQIAVPAIMATLAICIVFFPVVLLTGPARFLFTPMALSVVLAMMASYLLSRTLVPTLARMLMENEELHHEEHGSEVVATGATATTPPLEKRSRSRIGELSHRFNIWRDHHFDRFRDMYGRALEKMLHARSFVLSIAAALLALTMFLPSLIGTDFFPTTDTGLMKMHMRAPTGTRLEETERIVAQVEDDLRTIIPSNELETINDNVGVPVSYNLAFVPSDNASSMDAEFLVALKEDHHPTEGYMQSIRKKLAVDFPGCTFYFQSADIVSQVLNFGLSSPVDVQVQYPDLQKGYEFARTLRDAMRKIPGTADVVIKQVLDYPTLRVDIDRLRASQMGLNERDVTSSMLISLASSGLVAPSFFLNPQNNVNYSVVVQTPLDKVRTVGSLMRTPITSPVPLTSSAVQAAPTDVSHAETQDLGNIAMLTTVAAPNQINHYSVQRVLDVTSNVEGRDLGSVVSDIQNEVGKLGKLPQGMKINVRGQNEVKDASFTSLGIGIILAIALVYLLMVILYQSWLDPFIIMVAVPGALVGILWMLVLTGTTINVVSLMGSIMAVGIAVSNSILLVNFANDIRIEQNLSAFDAALEAGKTRLRPVLMTALAMILGMLPMALHSGEQNAPLGRAVIGGLLFATIVTLFIVPVVYSLLRQNLPTKHLLEAKFAAEEQGKAFDPLADQAEIAEHAKTAHSLIA